MFAAFAFMISSFATVVAGLHSQSVPLALLGVALGSFQFGLGESSFLALTSFFEPSRQALSAWSSGTGFAGIFGFAWVAGFTLGVGASFTTTLSVALVIFPPAYLAVYSCLLVLPASATARDATGFGILSEPSLDVLTDGLSASEHQPDGDDGISLSHLSVVSASTDDAENTSDECSKGQPKYTKHSTSLITFGDRLRQFALLYPYTVPLFIVYFAEYAMQSGIWAAIGFPLHDKQARKLFYQLAGWSYQTGVFISRSSGTIVRVPRGRLWLFPAIQSALLALFWLVAAYKFWYDWTLLLPCFVVGLLGGAVYVGAFSALAEEVEEGPVREFSLSAASLADASGVLLADLAGLLIQHQLYTMHGIDSSE